MKRAFLLVAALGFMLAVSALALQNAPRGFPLLDWAGKASAETPTIALVIEMGLKDETPRDWSGRASVSGAKVVRREGYRFRKGDSLTDPDGWQAQSHKAIRGVAGKPAIGALEPIATVGVVLHLKDVADDAVLTIEAKSAPNKAKVALKDIRTGRTASLWNGAAAVRLVSAASGVATGNTEDDFPTAAYGPDGTLWVAYIAYQVKEDSRRIEPPQLKEQPANFAAYDTPGFSEELLVQSYRDGAWSKPVSVMKGEKQDLIRCAIAVDQGNTIWLAYSAFRDGGYKMCTRRLTVKGAEVEVSREEVHTKGNGPDIHPVLCVDTAGEAWLAFQTWDERGQARIRVLRHLKGEWKQAALLTGGEGENCWHPALAASPTGQVAVAFDVYHNGNYDVRVAPDVTKSAVHDVATSPKFEARPALVFDRDGRLWVAYEEGPMSWGKDYGALAPNQGNPLYNERSVRVACLDTDGNWKRPKAELPTSHVSPPVLPFEPVKTNKYERVTRYAYPRIGLDGQGNVWVSYRQNFGSRYTTHPGPYWLDFVRRLDGDAWSEPIEVHHSDGLLDSRPVLLPHVSGGLLVVHNTDGRYSVPDVIDNQIFASVVAGPARSASKGIDLIPHDPGKNPPTPAVQREEAAIARLKKHRIQAGGKTYQLLRGEFHRHTEISWDGAPDGSLEDMFRYAIDAARMEWIGNGDHDNGAGREYSWHLTQKYTAAYHVADAFTPMFTYERSVAYPHGHRNVMFDRRGIRTLPRLAPPAGKKAEGGVHENDTKMLYRYLRELGGICASHTSATSMGTDWRDNDPEVEPIVEIYQGDRMSYEMEDGPRAGYDPKTGKEPANVAGWFPKGFINLPLQRGVKLGFQSSSDHWSTHISYMIVLAEGHSRKHILDAARKRHVYGATDNILVDFRCGQAIMGDEVSLPQAPTFAIHVVGTGDLKKIDVLRDSKVVATLEPKGQGYKSEWTDPSPQTGTHYYYIRVLQQDGELAWASPIWVTLNLK